MKIKAIREATMLTDRTIRYYIKEGLVSPAYTDNYLGRKTFDFSESDIRQLNDIAVLRKFGFSIAEIDKMLLHPERISQVIKDLQARKRSIIDEEIKLLQILLRLDANDTFTVSELAAQLSAPVADTHLPAEDEKWNIPQFVITAFKRLLIFAITWSPVVLSILVIMSRVHEYHLPVFSLPAIALTILSLMPTVLTGVFPKLKTTAKRKTKAKIILLILCFMSATLCADIKFELQIFHFAPNKQQ